MKAKLPALNSNPAVLSLPFGRVVALPYTLTSCKRTLRMGLVEELETLCRVVSVLTDEQARRVADIVNEKLEELLRPHIIDLLRRVDGKYGIFLESFASIDRARRGETSPFELQRDGAEKTGLWHWVFKNREPVWLENIHDLDLNVPAENLAADGTTTGPRYLS